jgi:hypothetical protein
MTRKVYRTAQGKMVDLGSLQLKNENVRAVGNMGVNARGDLVDSQNRPIDPKTQQVSRQYQRQISNVQNQSTHSKKPNKSANPESSTAIDVSENAAEIPGTETTGGLAAAIARARQIKQEPLVPAQKSTQDAEGVKKI